MAIYDQSYAPWSGEYSSRWSRIWSIVVMELQQPFKNTWTLLLTLLAFGVVFVWLFFMFLAASSQFPLPFAIGNRIYRESFFNTTIFSMILMVLSATVGASLIARDVRHRALIMYFSRSITRLDYLVGKFLSLVLFLLCATLGPGLLMFVGLMGIGQERLTFGERMGDLGAVTLHSLIMTVPMSAIVLAFSSLTKRTYLAAIFWTAFYFISVSISEALRFSLKAEWPKLLSWVQVTSHLGDLCYPVRGTASTPILECGWGKPFAILCSITVASLVLVWWRLRSVEGEE